MPCSVVMAREPNGDCWEEEEELASERVGGGAELCRGCVEGSSL